MKSEPAHTRARAPLALALLFASSLCASAQNAPRANATATKSIAETEITETTRMDATDHATSSQESPTATSQTSPSPTSPTPSESPTPSPRAGSRATPEHDFFKNILRDQRAIWTSPFHLNRGDARWLLPLSLSSAALFATDQETDEFGQSRRRARISRDVSMAGSIYTTAGVAAAFYLAGRAAHNERARETGVLGAEALVDAGVVFSVLKNVTQRQRPGHDEGQGEFFERGHSFPSGHATGAWALATVVANEYKSHRAVEVSAYALATAVSVSRFTGRNHFLSDVLVGSAIGYGVGRYVYRAHHDAALDGDDSAAAPRPRRKLLPQQIAPGYDPRERAYGVALGWDF
ncbi:MAG: phosphatase PAP2 family protein [Acidobacteria bacterium]|nr:phosphatase PAP2 family protein [Acidobacteriota bacterium]